MEGTTARGHGGGGRCPGKRMEVRRTKGEGRGMKSKIITTMRERMCVITHRKGRKSGKKSTRRRGV
jgi:hypothetical protein